MTQSVTYRVGMATGRDRDDGRAFLKAFGLGLKLERVKRGLSQDEFADLIGMHRTFEGQLERGQRGMNIVELPRIARALGVKPSALIPEKQTSEMKLDVHGPAMVGEDAELAGFLRQLGRRVRWLRFERELTQEELAAAASMSRSFVSLVEQGEHGMNLVRLYQLARVFGLEP